MTVQLHNNMSTLLRKVFHIHIRLMKLGVGVVLTTFEL